MEARGSESNSFILPVNDFNDGITRLNSGIGEHINRYNDLFSTFALNGIKVVSFDQRVNMIPQYPLINLLHYRDSEKLAKETGEVLLESPILRIHLQICNSSAKNIA